VAHVLLVSYFFTPDSLSTAALMAELAQDLHNTYGHKVTVVTTTPHYNPLPEALARQPLRPRWGRWLQESELDGIRVLHVQVAPKGSRVWARAFDYLRYHGLGTLAGWRLVDKPDILLVPSPPLTIGLQAWLLSLLHRAPFIYNVQEVYPDVAVRLGVLHNRTLIQLMEWVERFIYSRARMVTPISEWFCRTLSIKNIPAGKLRIISNFVDTDFMRPGDRLNEFSTEHDLDGKFVVLYAGNIGLTQCFEDVLTAAQNLAHLADLQFVIVGGGARRTWLEAELARRGIANVKLLPFYPQSRVPQIYSSSDLCLVPMKAGMAQQTFPSKIYTIMAAARPAIVSAETDSELAWVVQTAGCGWAVPPEDAAALTAAIEAAYRQRGELQNKGRQGREYVISHHSRQAVARQYHQLISEILGQPQ
jgi:colanic acid biosynthesis glycosyl transferase WcaI